MLSEPVLRLVLERVIIPDLDFERLLTAVRRFLLKLTSTVDGPGHWIFQNPSLVYALARQCYLNGYVFSESEEEMDLVERLLHELAGGKPESDPDDRVRIGILACYVPLLGWDKASEVAGAYPDPEFVNVLVQQIAEPLEAFGRNRAGAEAVIAGIERRAPHGRQTITQRPAGLGSDQAHPIVGPVVQGRRRDPVDELSHRLARQG